MVHSKHRTASVLRVARHQKRYLQDSDSTMFPTEGVGNFDSVFLIHGDAMVHVPIRIIAVPPTHSVFLAADRPRLASMFRIMKF